MPTVQAQEPEKPYKLGAGDQFGGKRWLFKAGHDPRWANPALNLSDWEEEFNPSESFRRNPGLWEKGEGWFRVNVQANAKNRGKSFVLVVEQFGESNWYLDGRPFAQLKPALLDSGGSQRLVRLLPFRLNDTNRHVMAIHYRFRKDLTVYANFAEPGITIQTEEVDKAAATLIRSTDEADSFVVAGVFGVLSLLHFLFFKTNKRQLINRTLAGMSLAFGLRYLLKGWQDLPTNLTIGSLLDLGRDLGGHIGFVLLLLAVYQYLNRPLGRIFWGLMALLGLEFTYLLFVGPIPAWLDIMPELLILAEYIRVSWLGRRTRDRDQRLPWNSLVFALRVLGIAFVLAIIGGIATLALGQGISEFVQYPQALLGPIGVLSVPVGLSLSMVRDYARTLRTLGDKLREVEMLSARTLAQEQEKQQLLAQQNEQLEHQVQQRTADLNESLEELRTTQAQLVQREKLAALGELTAGIAHEIQNPLNFVNNFAEISVELAEEIREERSRDEAGRDEELIDELLTDLGQNARKINEHGKRASSIVRGMLQHSRSSSGQKQTTDLNALVDEYLRLAYHGLRAKDKAFNCALETHFTPDLPQLELVPEDIGRVLVNLFNNAFYAVNQKKGQPDFRPTVRVQTAREANRLSIRIWDNGTGIPDEVKQKVFQPFFTTKPTGEGTGLGLSLSYDIISKGHGGTLNVSTEPGAFTEFLIELPV